MLEEQIDRELSVAIGNLVDQIGVDLAQGLGDEGIRRDAHSLEVQLGGQCGGQVMLQKVARNHRPREVLAEEAVVRCRCRGHGASIAAT